MGLDSFGRLGGKRSRADSKIADRLENRGKQGIRNNAVSDATGGFQRNRKGSMTNM